MNFVKNLIVAAMAAFAVAAAEARPASTRWSPAPAAHRHGVGRKCPHCGQTWGAIPHGLKAWEARHLRQELDKAFRLHLRLRHGVKPVKPVRRKA